MTAKRTTGTKEPTTFFSLIFDFVSLIPFLVHRTKPLKKKKIAFNTFSFVVLRNRS